MNIESIISRLQNDEDKSLVIKAYYFVNERLATRLDYESLLEHILAIANTLLDFNADSITVASSLLSELINNGVNKEEIDKEFSETIGNIAFGISQFNSYDKNQISEILESIPEGNKVLFIKLAERYYDMQSEDNSSLSNKQVLAQDTIDYLAPLALKFRFGYIKSKLEDLSLYYLEPDIYNFIVEKLGARPSELKVNLANMKANIESLLLQNNITVVIKSRVKNIYSIYNKMASGKRFEDIYDILAIRILVEEESDCSTVCDLIHSKYEMLPDRFKNYISCPKDNMYQSLHTTIIGTDGRFYEVQIRTNEMNKNAENGSASYVKYKEKTTLAK